MRRNFFLCILFVFGLSSSAQNDYLSSFQIGLKGGAGFIIDHSPTMEYVTEQHISKFEVYLEKNTFGNKIWEQRYKFPRVGISFSYFDFNNPEHLGKAYSISPYLNFKVLGKEKFQLRFKPAIGIGYVGKTFDVETNFKNSAIGSHFNIYVSLLAETEIQLSKSVGLLIGANVAHFSNTSFKKPNLGINIPTLEAGLYRRFGSIESRSILKEEKYQREEADWLLNLGFGINEINPPNGKKYIATQASLAREKRYNFKSSMAVSFDAFYNPAQVDALANDSIYIDKGWENMRLGISIYHVLHLGRLEQYFQAGYYLKTKNEDLGNFYHLVGGRYKINEQWSALMAIRTHFAKAEYLMLGVGIKLGGDEK